MKRIIFLIFVTSIFSTTSKAETVSINSRTEKGLSVDFKLDQGLFLKKNGSYCSSTVTAKITTETKVVSCTGSSREEDLSGFWQAVFNMDDCTIGERSDVIERIISEALIICDDSRFIISFGKIGYVDNSKKRLIEDLEF